VLGAVLALALVIPPVPTARVNDYADILTAGERGRLETILAERERGTGAQMVIAIFWSLKGENLEDFSIRLAQQWRIGQKGLDNGVILLVFVQDRKVRLEVGYGLEAVIPDAVAGQIIREVVAPSFRGGRYAEGLEGAVRAVFSRIQEGSEPRTSAWRWPLSPRDSILAILILAVFGYVLYGTSRLRGRHRRKIYTLGPGGWGVPSDPSWGGGGWSWGSGNSGGFSGGGGSFGGGGASGDW
jgi:uncharacterized protein